MKNAAKDEEKKSFVASFKVNHVDIGVANNQWRSRRIDVSIGTTVKPIMSTVYIVNIFFVGQLLASSSFHHTRFDILTKNS